MHISERRDFLSRYSELSDIQPMSLELHTLVHALATELFGLSVLMAN